MRIETKSKSVKALINDKMRILADFNICDRHDVKMRAKLEREVNSKPDKDALEVLDYYCRPMIQEKVNSWT